MSTPLSTKALLQIRDRRHELEAIATELRGNGMPHTAGRIASALKELEQAEFQLAVRAERERDEARRSGEEQP